MNLQTYRSVALIYGVLLVAVFVLVLLLPDDLLDWALFAMIAFGLKVEGGVMALNTTRRGTWTPTVVIIVLMRMILGLYFIWAVGLVWFDADRSWREDHEIVVYAVRSIALVAVLAELFCIPYGLHRRGGALDIVSPITGHERRSGEANDARDSRRDLERDVGRDIDRDLDRDIIRDPQRDLAHDAKTTGQKEEPA